MKVSVCYYDIYLIVIKNKNKIVKIIFINNIRNYFWLDF